MVDQTDPVGMTTASARAAASHWIKGRMPGRAIKLGLPEYDDRMNLWRVALLTEHNDQEPIGEVRLAKGEVVSATDIDLVARRIRHVQPTARRHKKNKPITFPPIPSTLVLGDARQVLTEFPSNSAQLVFTSPPYYNAKPEYHESSGYPEYLELLREVFDACAAVLAEGRFLVVNTSPVLLRRPHRNASSRRIPIPFDLHPILDNLGFEFVDDIIWQKPEGAGWHLGRGRRFAADRQPLQYKPVTTTEHVMVYRKRTANLIDWNIRNHPDPDAVRASLIGDDYERTDVWQIRPANHKHHPAVFPEALAERVIKYYSFAGDLVLDPFAGTGTTGRVAGRLLRRFLMIEKSEAYFDLQLADRELCGWEPRVSRFECADIS